MINLIIFVGLSENFDGSDLARSVAVGITILKILGVESVNLRTGRKMIIEVSTVVVQRKSIGLVSNHLWPAGHLTIRFCQFYSHCQLSRKRTLNTQMEKWKLSRYFLRSLIRRDPNNSHLYYLDKWALLDLFRAKMCLNWFKVNFILFPNHLQI